MALKDAGSKKNPFIAAPQDENFDLYQGKAEEVYIKPLYEAYQLKTVYDHLAVKEPELDSDDDEVITLAEQPYESVQDTCFKDFLNHLDTKFVARKSDIKVTSTLSFTLTPESDGFEPAKFSLLNPDQIWDYVMLKEEYRSTFVTSNSLIKSKIKAPGQLSTDSLDVSQSVKQVTETENSQQLDFFKSGISQLQNSDALYATYKLPATLLSAPLEAQKVEELSKNQKEMRLYKLQLQKYETMVQTIKKQEEALGIHPRDREFTLSEATKLLKGEFHFQEDEDDQKPDDNKKEQKNDLNRAMLVGKNDQNTCLKIDDFEMQLANVLKDIKDMNSTSEDPRIGDHVPQAIKDQLSLPKDMSDKDINFDNVRINDMKSKKRKLNWSGQEVLETSLNIAKSKIILTKMNKLRVWPKGFYNIVKKVRCTMKMFIRWSLFENFLTLCVLINTIGMAMDAYDISEQTKADLEFQNLIMTWIFICEMGLKLLARGPKKYTNEKMNLLDGGVVILSIVEIIMESIGGGSGAGSLQAFRTVRVFRTFRVLRVTRILRALKSMKQVISVMQRTISDFLLIILLMFVFIFIYTLLGRQIFQGTYDFGPDEELPRANYETFAVAFVTVFQVLTMENWHAVLYASMRAARGSMIAKAITAVYYISWIFIGNWVLLNLFLAILIDGFAEADKEDQQLDEEFDQMEAMQGKLLKEWKVKRMKKLGMKKEHNNTNERMMTSKAHIMKKKKANVNFDGKNKLRVVDLENIEEMETEKVRQILVEKGKLKAKLIDNIDKKKVAKEVIHADKSVYLFHRDGCFRRNIFFIQQHKRFDQFIMFLIALSSVKLAMNSYLVDLPKDDTIVVIGEEVDFAVNILFYVECIFKIIALGFAMDEGSYLRDSWNRLDFFIVVTTAIDQSLSNANIPALKVLRMLRMIRPLRVISHNPQLKMIVAALFQSVGSIINVSVIVVIIWLMFAIYGMNTFMGMFFYCSEKPYTYNTKWVCEDHGGEWSRFNSNFDNIGEAMMTLFIVASLEGWPDIMYSSIDVTRRDNGPKELASPAQSIFFIVFILIGAFFFLNFFIGVLFLKYEQARMAEEKGQTYEQLYWQEILPMITKASIPHEQRYRPIMEGFPGHSPLRSFMYSIIIGNPFDITIMICIVLNMFQMALDHEGASQEMLSFLKVSNYFFTAVFFIETVIKMYVYRQHYFKTGWNKFDFFVVASSLIDLGLELIMPKPEGGQDEESGSAILTVGPQLARVLRVLRVTRVLRLAGKYKGLQSLLKTIIMSVDSLFNVFILLMLIFFIMSVLANTLFSEVIEGEVIGEYKNFTNFHQSFMILFAISTGEDWNVIMYDCLKTPPDCEPGVNCGSSLAPLFFIVFIMLVTNIMLNLFILVIIQQFSKYYIEEDNSKQRFEDDFEAFKLAWEDFSEHYECLKIRQKDVPKFIMKLPQKMRKEMGFPKKLKEEKINKRVLTMGLKFDEGFIYFHEMLYRVMRAQLVTKAVSNSKIVMLEELLTQYKIADITLKLKMEEQEKADARSAGCCGCSRFKKKKKITEEEKEQAFLSYHGRSPVNLFLTNMFYRTSFKAWRSYMVQEFKKQNWLEFQLKKKAMYESKGLKCAIETTAEKSAKKREPIEIEREEYFAITCSSDDDIDKEMKIGQVQKKRRNTMFPGLDSIKDRLSLAESPDVSPEIIRKKAKERRQTVFHKLPLTLANLQIPTSKSEGRSDKKRKSMLIVHSTEDAIATQHLEFINPNSIEYQNAVLEDKINKSAHQLKKQALKTDALGNIIPGASLMQNKYAGNFMASNDGPINSGRKQE